MSTMFPGLGGLVVTWKNDVC